MHRCVAKCSGSVPSGNIAKVHNVKWIHTEFRKHLILTKKEGRISLKKRISLLVMLFISILAVTGCRAKEAADSLEISFKDYEFGDVDRICLGFEMQSAYIKSEPAIALFQELISEVSGSHGTSSQGYADGGYSISMMSGEKEVFTIQISENSILFGNTNNSLYPDRYEYASEDARSYEKIKQLCDLCFEWENEKLRTGALMAGGLYIEIDSIEGYFVEYNTYIDTKGIKKNTLPVTFYANDSRESFCLEKAGRISGERYDTLKTAENSADWELGLPEGVLEEYIGNGNAGASIYQYTEDGKEGYFVLYGRKNEDVVYRILFPTGLSRDEVYRIIGGIHVEAQL